MSNVLRNLPSVSELLESPPLRSLVDRVNRNVLVSRARRFLDDVRSQVQSATSNLRAPTATELAERIADWIKREESPALRPVVNATGVILNSQLGRVPLADEAISAIAAVGRGYASVALDLASGEAAHPCSAVESLLTRLTGAEAATVVNNNAGATLITLAALARDREVVVARGHLIELDDGYRLPEVISASGAVLREVGTANQTRLADYSAAANQSTAAVMRVHVHSFSLVGVKEEPALADLVSWSRKHDLPLIDNLGSAAVIDLSRYGLREQPLARDRVLAGADLVLFSGDKLAGGPQCGIIAGKRALVHQIVKHPLMRALRADKLTLAALMATLQLYEDPELAERSIPLLSLLATPLENLQHRASRLAPLLTAAGIATVQVVPAQTYLCGIPLAHEALPTICLAMTPLAGDAQALLAALRSGTPSVVGRLEDGKLLLDLRSVQPRDDMQIVAAFDALRASSRVSTEVPPLAPPAPESALIP